MNTQNTCDLELRLSPTSYPSDSSLLESTTSSGNSQNQENYQTIIIFYDGKMCVSSDVTHLQAKSILSMASRSEKEKNSLSSNGSDPSNRSTQFQHQLPNPKASMRKSLQSFLQKRKLRIQATLPYHQHSRR